VPTGARCRAVSYMAKAASRPPRTSMGQALLMPGQREIIVRRPAVVNHDAIIVASQDTLGHLAAARRIDGIDGALGTDERMQPGELATQTPAGFVQDGPVGVGQRRAQLGIDRFTALGGTQHGVGRTAAAQVDAEQTLQDTGYLAVRQAGLLVEFDHGGLGVGPELGCGRSQGIGSLQRMPTLDTALAMAAAANVDIELPPQRSPRNLDLILLIDSGLVKRTATVGAGVGKRRLVDLVDLLGRRPLRLATVIGSRLASRLLRLFLGLTLGKRSRLTFAGATLLVQEARETFDLSFQLSDASLQGLTSWTAADFHDGSVAGLAAHSCASLPEKTSAPSSEALNNYRALAAAFGRETNVPILARSCQELVGSAGRLFLHAARVL
jgi:hypothetical protein